MPTDSDADELLNIIDGLNDCLAWSLSIAALIASYDDADQIIRNSADSIERHLRTAQALVGEFETH